ncbi:hypothetical protein MMC15_005698 [Xylographa vitiligo]|nr:hypothetical protein [Xylographa vitiligo]
MATIPRPNGYHASDPQIGAFALHTRAQRVRRTWSKPAAYRPGDVSALQVLLNYRINVRAEDYLGKEALHLLADSSLELSETPESKASAQRMVELMLKDGADVDAEDNYSKTPLFCALKRKNWWLVQMLPDNGARELRKNENDHLYAKLYAKYATVKLQGYAEGRHRNSRLTRIC